MTVQNRQQMCYIDTAAQQSRASQLSTDRREQQQCICQCTVPWLATVKSRLISGAVSSYHLAVLLTSRSLTLAAQRVLPWFGSLGTPCLRGSSDRGRLHPCLLSPRCQRWGPEHEPPGVISCEPASL